MPISLKNTTSVLPWARYSPQANMLTIAGEDGKPRELPFVGKSFAMDPENGSTGWLLIAEGARDLETVPDRRRRAAFPWSKLQTRDSQSCFTVAEVIREPGGA